MKVILLENVPKVGQKYDVKDVSDGYGRNFLIAQGKAKIATPSEEQKIVEQKKYAQAEQHIQHDLLEKNIAELEGKTVSITAKANEKGHLFASVSSADVSQAIKSTLGIDIPSNTLQIDSLKETGSHEVNAHTDGAHATFTLTIEQE